MDRTPLAAAPPGSAPADPSATPAAAMTSGFEAAFTASVVFAAVGLLIVVVRLPRPAASRAH